MKVPAKHKKWPSIYGWGYEDAQAGKVRLNIWVKDAQAAYDAGYDEGTATR